jgi:hypothetical protein
VLDPAQVPPVDAGELLARFVLFSRHVRSSDNTVKPEAFMPHPRVELSLTRHREATDEELWNEGIRVASIRTAALYGRADVSEAAFAAEELKVVAKPISENPNHADAIGWPAEKPAQKIKALQIAGKANFLSQSVADGTSN